MKVVGILRGKPGSLRNGIVEQIGERLGASFISDTQEIPADADVLLSWRFKLNPSLERAVAKGCTLVCFDLGYWDATRLEEFSICINGVHGLSQEIDTSHLCSRWHPEVQPWRSTGSTVQIIHPGYAEGIVRTAASGLPDGWVEDTAVEAAAAFDAPVDIRWHPNKLPAGVEPPGPLEASFDETLVSITYGSTSAIQTVLAGVPTIAFHPRAVAYDLCAHDYSIYCPVNRDEWARGLSHRQYHMYEEMDEATAYVKMALEQAAPMVGDLKDYGIRA